MSNMALVDITHINNSSLRSLIGFESIKRPEIKKLDNNWYRCSAKKSFKISVL